MNYLFKRLGPTDIQDFKKLLLVFLQVFGDTAYDMKDDYLKTLLKKENYYAVTAFDNDIVIGGVTGYELELPNHTKELYVYDLAVDEKYRKQGVATALLNELQSSAKKNGVSLLFVEAESQDLDAVGFYQSLGAGQIKVEHFTIKF